MTGLAAAHGGRILLIDDLHLIHEDFERIFTRRRDTSQLEELAAELFGSPPDRAEIDFELDSAYQGEEGLAKLEAALQQGRPYAVAFVDMRMPPGWDGLETIERLWACDPRLQIVACTAHSDYSWDKFMQRLNAGDNLLVLKKPFDPIEVMQMARALCGKWETARRTAAEMLELECRNEELGRLARAADAFQACWSATQAATPRAEVDMAAVLRGVAGDLARTGEGRQAIVQADPLPKVAGHEPALTQVLRHLVDNAIKFVPADRVPAVRVGCSEAPVEWVFSVTDNGTGIAADLSDRIFTIAPRQHRHDDQERMGVGLAVCRSIVESYGGRIWVEPPAGGGATLCFAIPR